MCINSSLVPFLFTDCVNAEKSQIPGNSPNRHVLVRRSLHTLSCCAAVNPFQSHNFAGSVSLLDDAISRVSADSLYLLPFQ